MGIKLKIQGKNMAIKEDDGSMAGKLLSAVKGKIFLKTPFGTREVELVKEKSE